MKIRLFGSLADVLGRELDLAAPAGSVGDIRHCLAQAHPEAAAALDPARSRACIGDAIVPETRFVEAGEALEFLPPVSGG